MTQVVNHKGERLKVGPRGGVTIFVYTYKSTVSGNEVFAHLGFCSGASGYGSRDWG